MTRGGLDVRPNRLGVGKIPIRILNSTVLKMVGAESDRIVTPAKAGVDFAAVKVGGGFMLVSADPVTGVSREIGRYAVKVSANDVATSGCRPQFAESIILLPEGSTERDVGKVARQVHEAARESGISILGGHTEVTPGLRNPIVAVTTFAFADKFVTSADAKVGDTILMTKTAGLEGTAVLGEKKKFLDELSVIEEAVAAYRTGHVHAMHDCTEGGVLGAAFEMSLASNLGFEMDETLVPVATDTRSLCRRYSIDPLRLIGSGSLLLSVNPGREEALLEALHKVCRATVVGKFVGRGRTLIHVDGTREPLRAAPEDELWRVLSRRVRSGDRL